MRHFPAFFILLLPLWAVGDSALPDLACQVLEEVTVSHAESLPATHTEAPSLYRIAESKLYLSSPDSDEYLYGDLTSTDWLRFNAGFKTILFASDEFTAAVEVHTDSLGTRVRRLHCSRI